MRVDHAGLSAIVLMARPLLVSLLGKRKYRVARRTQFQGLATPMAILTISTITCPSCAHKSAETMPVDACQYLYDCRNCGGVLKPKPGDCCVYCSYGDVPCPPIQEQKSQGRSLDETVGN